MLKTAEGNGDFIGIKRNAFAHLQIKKYICIELIKENDLERIKRMIGQYTLQQWILYFYVYCFLGWIFESCYVSFRKKEWVNRGFLHGPFLPIYGSGAVMMLFVSEPFKDNLILTYFAGVLGATLLELVTGAVMEDLLKVRYWDYSNQKFNYKGYICLSSSGFSLRLPCAHPCCRMRFSSLHR